MLPNFCRNVSLFSQDLASVNTTEPCEGCPQLSSGKWRMTGSGPERKSACRSGGPVPEVHPPYDLRATGPSQRVRMRELQYLPVVSSPEDPQRRAPLRPQPENRRALLLTGPVLQALQKVADQAQPQKTMQSNGPGWAAAARSSAPLASLQAPVGRASEVLLAWIVSEVLDLLGDVITGCGTRKGSACCSRGGHARVGGSVQLWSHLQVHTGHETSSQKAVKMALDESMCTPQQGEKPRF